MSINEKIDAIEYLTRVHYAPYQWVSCGLIEYFELLRKHKPGFLMGVDSMEFSYEVRDCHHREIING